MSHHHFPVKRPACMLVHASQRSTAQEAELALERVDVQLLCPRILTRIVSVNMPGVVPRNAGPSAAAVRRISGSTSPSTQCWNFSARWEPANNEVGGGDLIPLSAAHVATL